MYFKSPHKTAPWKPYIQLLQNISGTLNSTHRAETPLPWFSHWVWVLIGNTPFSPLPWPGALCNDWEAIWASILWSCCFNTAISFWAFFSSSFVLAWRFTSVSHCLLASRRWIWEGTSSTLLHISAPHFIYPENSLKCTLYLNIKIVLAFCLKNILKTEHLNLPSFHC